MNKDSKESIVEIDGQKYLRIPVKTHILTPNDDMAEVILRYSNNIMKEGDIISISESPMAITQGRAIPIKDINPGILAKILWRFVKKVPYGTGLRSPYSMQCAIDEAGALRILFAAVVGGIGKLFGRSGDFYRIAGKQPALIDAAFTSPVPPYDKCVIKGPKEPEKEAWRISKIIGNDVAIMDINDIGGSWVIGHTKGVDKELLQKIMKDNPQGQNDELTPICIIRKV
jgi:hypothetical protein